MRRRRRRRRGGLDLEQSGPWIAVAGLLMLLWCTVSTALYAPWWGVMMAFALLLPHVWLVTRWARTRPASTIWVPLAGLLAWTGLSLLGAAVWGWKP